MKRNPKKKQNAGNKSQLKNLNLKLNLNLTSSSQSQLNLNKTKTNKQQKQKLNKTLNKTVFNKKLKFNFKYSKST